MSRGGRLLPLLPGLAVALLALAAPAAAAPEVEARVVSVRGERVYLEVTVREQAREGSEVVLRLPSGETVRAEVVAVSSRYLVVLTPEGTALERDQPVGLDAPFAGDGATPPARSAPAGASVPSGVRVGRPAPTAESFQQGPLPEREPVVFRSAPALETSPTGGAAAAIRQDADGGAPPGEDGLTASGLPANDIRGSLELGVDGAYDEAAGISRTTPFGRLRFEVRRLFGSDRARFFFSGGFRQALNDGRDWTGANEGRTWWRISALALEVEAALEPRSLTDRLELGLGRDVIPDVVEAGLVDGGRVGLRLGSITPFLFGGFAVSADPRPEDYESFIYGGGVRLAHAFGHTGALRLSLAAAQERFRDTDGERDFVEARGEARLGGFGLRGALVIDFFDSLRDRQDTRITHGLLAAYAQLGPAVRLDAGYRERRPQWQAEVLRLDFDLDDPTLDPAIRDAFLRNDQERRNVWAGLTLTLGERWEARLRGEAYQGDELRDAQGVVAGLSFTPAHEHRLDLDVAVRRRLRGPNDPEPTTDPSVVLRYSYRGEAFRAAITTAYHDSLPDLELYDRRFALRLDLDRDIGAGFAVRGYMQLDLRRSENDDGVAAFVGLAGRYRF